MVRDSVQLETAVNTISHEYLLEFTSEYGISEMLHPELPGPGDKIVDFPEGKRTNAPKDGMSVNGTYSVEAVRALDTHRTPIQKQPEMLLCLVGFELSFMEVKRMRESYWRWDSPISIKGTPEMGWGPPEIWGPPVL
nr:hypothetical protein [Tanacetum cinerariifolium]